MADHLLVLYAEVGEAAADTGLEPVSLAPRNALV